VDAGPGLGFKALQMKNLLRELRAQRGWSQTELGERLKVSRQTINAIENERYDPSLPLAFEIARVFEMPIEAIFSAA
jgi:putative transcriptional regulator